MNRFDESRGKTVVSRSEGANVGKFDDFQFDLRTWEVYGYRLKPNNVFGKAGGVAAEKLDRVGRDVAFVNTEADVEWTGGGRNTEDGRSWASAYVGTKVISRDGTSMGEVEDLVFDPQARRLLAVILNDNRIALVGEKVATGSAAVVLESAGAAAPLTPREKGEAPTSWWERVLHPAGDKPEGHKS